MVTAGPLKKAQFYAALALLLGVAQAGATELYSMAEVQQELTEKIDAVVSRKLEECREREKRNLPYPVRIAEQKPANHGLFTPLRGVQVAP